MSVDVLAAPSIPTSPPAPADAAPARPWWGRWTQLAVAAVAGVVLLVNLSANALGNPYYAAAVKSGSVSWKAFLFGSLDPGSFITVDKPPAAFWVQAISVRIFGYSSWSLLVPDALAGIAAVAITYHLARRLVGAMTEHTAGGRSPVTAEVAAILAGGALAFTPIAAVMFRFNDPDALLTALLVAAAWAGWVAIERASIRHLVLAGVLIGLAFDAKMLEAAIAVPGLALAWIICAPTGLRRRFFGWLAGGVAMVVSAGWWVALVSLWPAASRPYIGSTTDNSLLSLIFGYNGLSRIFGNKGGGRGGAGAAGDAARRAVTGAGAGGGRGGAGGIFGGQAGWGRLFSSTLGDQIGWLIPLAGAGLIAGLVIAGRSRRTDRARAGFLLVGLWAAAGFVVFSKASGTFHGYYTVAIAPPIAILAAAGSVALWQIGKQRRWSWLLPAALVGSAIWAFVVLDRDASYAPWLRVAVVVAAGAGALILLAARLLAGAGRHRVTLVLGTVLATVGIGLGPAAWTISSLGHGANGTNPTAGPATAGGLGAGFAQRFAATTTDNPALRRAVAGRVSAFAGGAGFGSSAGPTAANRSFVSWLEANRDGTKYLVAVDGSMSADNLIIASGQPVMAMGGFSGSDPAPTLAGFEKLVRAGQVRYVLVSSRGGGGFGGGAAGGGGFGRTARTGGAARTGGFGGFGAGRGTTAAVDSWVEAHGTVVPASSYGGTATGTLYLVTPSDVR